MPLNDIVNVVITRQTQTISEQGFGIPMIFGANANFDELIRYYSTMDEVAIDFNPTDPEYIAAQNIFSQNISPDLIAIGRRQVDEIDVNVVTAMTDEDYILTINGDVYTINSTSTATYSVATLNADLVPGNIITLNIGGTPVSVTSTINFNADFVTGNSIVPTINGSDLAAVPFNTDQAQTIADVAARIASNPGVFSATVTGAREITVVFISPVTNIVTSVVTTGGASQPTTTIAQVGFVFSGSSANTMSNIANALQQLSSVDIATVSGTNNRILTVQGPVNTTVALTNFVVTGGVSQPTATLTYPLMAVTRESIANDIYDYIHNLYLTVTDFPVDAVDNGDGTFTITNASPGTNTPFTFRVTSSIGSPNRAVVRVTQVAPGLDYTIKLNNIDFTYRSSANVQNSNDIATALTDLINDPLSNVAVTATNVGDGSIVITSDNLNNSFSISATNDIMDVQKGLDVLPLSAVNSPASDLDRINNYSNLWYALIAIDRDPNTVLDIAAWTEAHIKLFGTASADPQIINVAAGTDVNSIAAKLGQLGYVRSFVMYHQDANLDYPEAAWFGAVLPLIPGSETWKFKTLNGVSYSNLTTTQSLNALGKKANTYEFVAGIGITQNGTVAQGEYIDIIRGVDWLTARIQEYVFRVLVTNPKVPYTDAGIASIQAEVLRVLSIGIDNGFIAENPEPTCTVPLAASVPPADKAARILRNVRFQATLSGAIHAVVIRGTVSV